MSYIKENITVKEAAIDYVRHGVCVMPAWKEAGKWTQNKHHKYPVKPYEGLWTEERIRNEWRDDWQLAMFLLPNPKWSVSVIDLDRDKSSGTWEPGVSQITDKNSSTYVNDIATLCERNLWVRSPSGGVHIYVKRDDRLRGCNALGGKKGIDIRNDHRRFIVAPPSVSPVGEYRWFGKYSHIDFDDPKFQPKEDKDLVEALLFLQGDNRTLPSMQQGVLDQKKITREQLINANYVKRGEDRRVPTEKQKERSERNRKQKQKRSEREKNNLITLIEQKIRYVDSNNGNISVIDRLEWRTTNRSQHELQKILENIENKYPYTGRCSG
jgi:hypothetical protein